MKKMLFVFLLAAVLVLSLSTTAFAATRAPLAGCPSGFEQVNAHLHDDMEHHGQHVGITFDLNGDQQICVRHLSSGYHVHLDNVVR